MTAVTPPLQRFFYFLFLKFKNGSGEMGAEVDPAVSSGCCGAPSQTRPDLNVSGNATSLSVGR